MRIVKVSLCAFPDTGFESKFLQPVRLWFAYTNWLNAFNRRDRVTNIKRTPSHMVPALLSQLPQLIA